MFRKGAVLASALPTIVVALLRSGAELPTNDELLYRVLIRISVVIALPSEADVGTL